MGALPLKSNSIVAAAVAAVWFSLLAPACAAQTPELDRLFEELAQEEQPDWQRIESEIWAEWSKSGSPAMDLLLQRGRNAMQAGDLTAAVEHLTALVDHAPDFAEGWNMRATAFFQMGAYGPSLEDIRHVLALNPRHFGALSGLGMILQEIGRPEQAVEALRAAQAIHPHSPSINQALDRLERTVSGTDL